VDTKGGFDRIAARYDRWYSKPAHQLIDRIERRNLKVALPEAAGSSLLLDVGIGTGHWWSLLEQAGHDVVGLDASWAMLEVARARIKGGCPLVEGDTLCLPFPDACFDVIYCVTTLEFVDSPERALDEIDRCLKPGGTIVLGLLNAFSFLGFSRRLLRKPTYRNAHFFTVKELNRILPRYGSAEIVTCAFMPPWDWLVAVGEWLEKAGKVLTPGSGQLIVANVVKPGHRR
jgi:ubiquinone/menaquinone biosynthesis C-methylase UbiE